MKPYSEFVRNRTFPFLTVLVLLILAGGYYLFYVQSRESYFADRYSRLLAFETERLEDRISAYQALFESYQEDQSSFRPSDLLHLDMGLELSEPPPDWFPETVSSTVLAERVEDDQLWIYAGRIASFVYRLKPFEQIQPNREKSFDSFFVARRDGTVLFQQGRKDLKALNVEKWQTEEGEDLSLATLANGSSQVDVRFAGESYKLFLQPCCRNIRETARRPTATSEWRPDWVVGGLVSTPRLFVDSMAISFTTAIILVALLVFVILVAPFLRVLYIGPEDKLRVIDALAVGLTAMAGVGLLTLLLLDLHSYRRLAIRADNRLEDLAEEISVNVKSELVAASKQLLSLNKVVEPLVPQTEGPMFCGHVIPEESGANVLLSPKVEYLASKLPEFRTEYMDFERFAWVDSKGEQCFKWTLGRGHDRLVNVKERRYFRDTIEGRLWTIPLGDHASEFPFTVEPVVSWTTGQRVVVLATPVLQDRPANQRFVGILSIDLSSLSQPVLPPGYGFAVVDEAGEVLFHSDPSHSGHENFFDEIERNRRVRAAVHARRGGHENAPYMGRGHRLYIKTLGDVLPQWTLITFSDKREIRGLNLDVVTTAMLLLILHLIIFMAVCWGIRIVQRSYRATWLWPDDRNRNLYAVLFGLYLFGVCTFGVAIMLLEGVQLLWFAFAFPWAILLVSGRLRAGETAPRQRNLLAAGLGAALLLIFVAPESGAAVWPLNPAAAPLPSLFLIAVTFVLWRLLLNPYALGRWSFDRLGAARKIYLHAASLLLVIVAVLPAASFFCVAHRAHLETRVRHGQLQLELGLEQRAERLKKVYAAFSGGREDLLHRRLRDISWDVYHPFCDIDIDEPSATAGSTRAIRASLETPRAAGGSPLDEMQPRLLPNFLQQVLPLYTEDFVQVRRLIEDRDRGGDKAWIWRSMGRRVQLERRSHGDEPVFLSSVIPPVSPWGLPLLLPFSVLLLWGTVYWLVQFIAQKFFLLGLSEGEPPVRTAGTGENLILVTPETAREADGFTAQGRKVIDLQTINSRENLLHVLGGDEPLRGPVVCIHHFEHCLQNEEHNLWKLELLEELIYGRGLSVVVLSHVVPTWYLLERKVSFRPLLQEPQEDPEKVVQRAALEEKVREEVQERWRKLLRKFTLSLLDLEGDESALAGEQERLLKAAVDRGDLARQRMERFISTVREESRGSALRQGLALDLLRRLTGESSPDSERFIEDLRENAEGQYRMLWAVCTEPEKIVLVHLAEGGLVNSRNAPAFKKLLARGLVRKSPFRLVNESFRRFVSSSFCQGVVRDLERHAEASAWSKIRTPLIAVLMGAAAFVFITQRQVFDTSMAFVGALAASLPALFRVIGSVAPSRSKGDA